MNLGRNHSTDRRIHVARPGFDRAACTAVVALLAVLGAMPAARAQSTWLGNGTDANWNTANNWSTALSGNFNTGLVFAGSTQLSNTNTLTGGTATSITFNAGAGAFVISGSAISLSGNLANNSSNLQTLGLNVALTNNATVSGTSITLSSTFTNSGGSRTVTNNIAAGGLLTLGAINLSESNTGRILTLAGSGNTLVTGSIGNGGTGAGTLSISNSGTTTLTGSSGWTSTTLNAGAGVFVFSGANGANSGTGSYTVNAGTLVLDNTGVGKNNNTRIADTSGLVLGGGSFLYKGSDQAGTNSTETIGAITQSSASGGNGVITVSYGGSNLATLTSSSFTHTTGFGATLVNGLNLGKNSSDTGSVGKLIITTAPTLVGTTAAVATGINLSAKNTQVVPFLVGEATATTGGLGTATGTANTFLTYVAGSGLRPLNLADEFTNNSISSGNNTYITAATAAGSTASINSLVLNGGDLSIADGATLTNTSGALLFATSNAIRPANTTGSLTFGSNTEAMITVNPGVTGTISAPITGTGSNALTISGGGTLVLSGSNSYTGNTSVVTNQTLIINNNNALGSGSLLINGNGSGSINLDNTSGSDRTITNSILLNGSPTFLGTGNLAITDTTTISGGSRTITVNANTLTLKSINADTTARTFTKAGAGTLAITDAAGGNFQGGVTLSAGSLILGNNAAMGAGTFTATSGTLQASVDLTNVANNVTNTALTVSGSTNITLTGTFSNAGGGDRTLTNNLDPSKTLTLGAVNLTNASTTRSMYIAGTGNTTITGTIATPATGAGGGLFISNTGTTTIQNASTYTGATTLSAAGTVILGNNAAFGTTGGVTTSGAVTIRASTDLTNVQNAFTLTANPTFSGSSNITLSGSLTNSGGNRTLTSSLDPSKTLTFSGTTALQESGTGVGRTMTLAGTGNTTFSGPIVNGGTAGNSAFTITNTGTTLLSGVNTYTGLTTVSNGVLALQGGSAIADTGTISLGGGSLLLNTSETIGQLSITAPGTVSGVGTLTSGSYAVSNTSGTASIGVALAGTGGFTMSGAGGTVLLSASNSYSGPTTLSAASTVILGNNAAFGTTGGVTTSGAVTIRASTDLTNVQNAFTLTANPTFSGSSNITLSGLLTNSGNNRTLTSSLDPSKTLTFSGTTALQESGTGVGRTMTLAGTGNTTFSGPIVNGGTAGNSAFTITNTGTTLLSGVNTYTGLTTVSNGVLALQGGSAIADTGTISLGGGSLLLNTSETIGQLSITAPATVSGVGTLTSGSYAVSNTSGTATISATLAGTGGLAISGAGGTLMLTGNNTFTGPVVLSTSGVVSVSTIGDAGVAGNLGAAANVTGTAPIIFQGGSPGTKLFYTGAGESSNRNITLDFQLGNAAAIVANGSGNLTLTGAFDMTNRNSTNGACLLILTGTNTAANTLSGGMTEAGGNKISISKQDAGTWVLSGIRNYSAVTDVQNGILQFNSIANTGTASALGTGASPYAVLPAWGKTTNSGIGTSRIPYQIALGGTATSGTLQYTGTSAGTSNRTFGFNNNGTFSTAAGSGALSLSGTFAPVVSSNVAFTLDAANSGTNTISGVIADLASASTTALATNSGTNAILVNSASGFSIGQTLTGLNIANGSIITGISTGTIFVSNNTTGAISAGTTLSAAGSTMSLAKTGAGIWALTGTNTFSGATTVNAGILAISSSSALQGTSGVTIADAARLRYSGNTSQLFGKNITVSSGTGTIENSGAGTLTLSGTLSKDNSVLRLTGGSFNVTGLITGATPGKSDLFVDGASVQLSNTNSYNGPTVVYNGGTLVLGTNSAIPSNSVVTLGGPGTGTLDLGGFANTIGGLLFSGSGGTLKMAANQTVSAQLVTSSSLALGAGTALDLTGMGTTAGLYRLMSYTSQTGTFATVTGLANGYQLVYGSTALDAQQQAVLGAVTVTNPAAAIITGGSAAFTYTVANANASNGASLSFSSTSPLSNVAGSSSGTTNAASTSGAIAGLVFTGTSVGSGKTGTFTVNAPSAYGSTTATGTVSVNVYDHASGSAAGATIALADSIVGYTGSLAGLTSATISNAAGYRVDLMTTGGTSAGFVNINNVSGIAAGSSATISAAAALNGSQTVGSNALGQVFSLTYADDSVLAGASSNLGSQSITVTGNVLDHSLPGFLASGITNAYAQDVLNINFGSVDESAGQQSFTYNLLNLASQTYGAGLTAGLDFTGVTADGGGFASGLTTFNNLVGGGTSSLFTFTFNPSGQGTFSKTFTLSFYDNRNLSGAASRRDLTINAQVFVVPEPGALALAGIGVALAGWSLARRPRR